MNKVMLIGRLVKEPELKTTSNGTEVTTFSLAVDRRFKDSSGNRQTDFINIVAWKQTATFITKYFHKGNRIGIVGNIQTRSYEDQNGQKHFITEVVADEAEFVENNSSTAADTIEEQAANPQSLPFEI